MMGEIRQLFKKNLRIVARNRFSLFFLLFSPLIIIFLTGLLYINQTSFSFTVGTIAENQTELYLKFENSLLNSNLNINKFDTEAQCLDSLKAGLVYSCIYFPPHFEIRDDRTNVLRVTIDTSRGSSAETLENLILSSIDSELVRIQFEYLGRILFYLERTEVLLEEQFKVLEEAIFSLNKISEIVVEVETEFSTYDAIFEEEDLQIDNIEGDIDLFERYYQNFATISISNLEELQEDLKIFTEIVDAFNISNSDKDDILGEIDAIESEVILLRESIEDLRDRRDFFDIEEQFVDLKTKLGSIEEDLDNFENDLLEINTQLEFYSDSLNEKNSDLLGVTDFLLTEMTSLQVRNLSTLVRPILIQENDVIDQKNDLIGSLFPTLLVTLVSLLALFIGASLTFKDKNSRGSKRLILTKASSNHFLFSNLLTVVFVVFLQIVIIVVLYSIFVAKESILREIPLILALVLLLCIVFSLIGFIVGSLVKSETSYIISLFALVFLFFLGSGKILPLEVLSGDVLRYLTLLNPYYLAESLLRKILLFNVDITVVRYEVLILGVMGVVFYLVELMIESYQKRRRIFYLFLKRRK